MEDKIIEDFKPFFNEMVNEIVRHYPKKGDTWKICDIDYLEEITELHMHKYAVDGHNHIKDDDLIDISVLCGMLFMRKKFLVYHSYEDVN